MRGDEGAITSDPERVRADVDSWPTGRLLAMAARVVEGRFEGFLNGLGLTHAGLIALHHLAGGPLSQRELARLCRVTDQTMSRTVDRLARAGHAGRAADPRDRRRSVVTITGEGAGALAAARSEEQRSEQLLGAVDDYHHFRHQLITLIAHVGR